MWESRKSPGLNQQPSGNGGFCFLSSNPRYHHRLLTIQRVLQVVESFGDSSDPVAIKSRELTCLLLLNTPFPFSHRQFTPGHVTATGLVLAPDGERLLLVHHAKLNRWLLPGGHIEEEDDAVWKTASREVTEETGVVLSQEPGVLAGLDVHGIPAHKGKPYHLHHDLIFHFRAESEDYQLSHESRAVAWAHPDHFESYELPSNIRLAYQRVLALNLGV
jgi:8-oxo-dGTP pyrophosphatase MutT (NUDIX family)